MDQWIRDNFEILTNEENQEIFKSRIDPESYTVLSVFLNLFNALTPSYDVFMANVGETGFVSIFDSWKSLGIIN